MPVEIFDIETDSKDVSSLIHCIAIKELRVGRVPDLYYDTRRPDETGSVTSKRSGTIADGLLRLSRASGIIAHNGVMFDIPTMVMLAPAYGSDYSRPDPRRVFDTVLVSRLLYSESGTLPSSERRGHASAGPHSLEAWGYHFGRPKVEHEDWSKLSDEMLHRCSEDVAITEMVADWLLPRSQSYGESVLLEHRIADIISRQIWGGITIDVEALERLSSSLAVGHDTALKKLRGSFPDRHETMKTPAYHFMDIPSGLPISGQLKADTKGGVAKMIREHECLKPRNKFEKLIAKGPLKVKVHPFDPTGDKFALELIDKYNWKPSILTETGKPAMNKDTYPTIPYEEVLWFMECKKCQTLTSDMVTGKKSVLQNMRETGKLHPGIITNGAFTGRMTHSFHIAQISRVKKNKAGEILTGLAGNFGWDARSCFIPRPGWWQIGADAAGLEMRMLANELAPYDGGALIDIILNGDVHDYMQERLGLATRDMTKTAEYLLIYGGGNALLGTRIRGDQSMTPEQKAEYMAIDPTALGKRTRSRLMKNVTGMEAFTNSLKDEARRNRNYIFLADGRPVYVRKEHAILNTKLQGNGAIMMKRALCIMWDILLESGSPFLHDEPWHGQHGNWQLLMNTHDEFQAECDDKEYADTLGNVMVKSMILSGEALGFLCPMDGTYTIGKSWAETH